MTKKKDYIREGSENIADRCVGRKGLVGFDPMTIITLLVTLLPTIINLFKNGCGGDSDDEEDPVEFVERNYNEDTGEYNKKLQNRVASEAMKKAKKKGKRLSKEGAQVIAYETLEEVRTQPRKVGAAMRQVG